MIEPYFITDEREADAYLHDLLERLDHPSIEEVHLHAQHRIRDRDENLRRYFVTKGKEMLDAIQRP